MTVRDQSRRQTRNLQPTRLDSTSLPVRDKDTCSSQSKRVLLSNVGLTIVLYFRYRTGIFPIPCRGCSAIVLESPGFTSPQPRVRTSLRRPIPFVCATLPSAKVLATIRLQTRARAGARALGPVRSRLHLSSLSHPPTLPAQHGPFRIRNAVQHNALLQLQYIATGRGRDRGPT